MIEKLIPIAVAMTMAAAATGQLPKAVSMVRRAQLQLVFESQASKWPKAMTLPKFRRPF